MGYNKIQKLRIRIDRLWEIPVYPQEKTLLPIDVENLPVDCPIVLGDGNNACFPDMESKLCYLNSFYRQVWSAEGTVVTI